MELLIPCAFGLEQTVKRELIALGYGACPAENGSVRVRNAAWEDVARLNVFLRAGERVQLLLGQFRATTFDELFEGVSSLPFEEFLSTHSKIVMDGKCLKSALMAVKACGGVAKKAIVLRLKQALHTNTLDESGERAIVGLSLLNDIATVTLDCSGEGLHKRGYRTLAYDAPLKETVAAAMIQNSYFRAGKPFADLFCGSGTIPIEAALFARNIAPGRMRTFDFAAWKCAPRAALARAREEADAVQKRGGTPFKLAAFDVSSKAISLAKYHAKRAGVEGDIDFSCADMRTFSSLEPFGVLISNPPYGKRLSAACDLTKLYRDFAAVYRALPDWSCYFLSGFEGAERAFGRRADRRKILYNANLPCGFYSYFGAKPPALHETQKEDEN